MAFKITKSPQISEKIEFTDENDKVIESINVVIDVEKIYIRVVNAQKELQEAEKKLADGSSKEKIDAYEKSITLFLMAIFGEENTKKIIDFYDGKYIAALEALFPFIRDVVYKRMNDYALRKSEQLKALAKFNK